MSQGVRVGISRETMGSMMIWSASDACRVCGLLWYWTCLI
jgi:hypothetical protein